MTSIAMTPDREAPDRSGLVAGLVCYLIWGFLPLLFGATERLGASGLEIVAWRTLWAAPLAIAFVAAVDRGASARDLLQSPRILLMLLLSATLIAINWTTYVLAVVHGQILAASLGYYLAPLVNVASGALFFKERITRIGMAAVVLAVIGVAMQGVALHGAPFIPVILACSFGGYGVVRKHLPVSAQTGLMVECLYLSMPALAYVGWLAMAGHGAFGRAPAVTGMLLLCGPATVIPLVLFAFAARRLTMSLVGFLQFITPTLQFGCGLAAGERLSPLAALSFAFIWAGVIVFVLGAVIQGRRRPSGSA
jgi:chloramphenicol-sensitive protein RarD